MNLASSLFKLTQLRIKQNKILNKKSGKPLHMILKADLLTFIFSAIYTGALYFHSTNCLKSTSKIRMIKLENVHNFFWKNMLNMSYILVMIQWEIERHSLNLYGSWDCFVSDTVELQGETIVLLAATIT